MKKLSIFLLLMLAVIAVIGSGVPTAFAAMLDSNLYDKQSVLTDLKDAVIAGEKFDANNYPYADWIESKILTLTEYAYTLDKDRQNNYRVYIYVYNPSGKAIDTGRNRVKIATAYSGEQAVDHEMFDLELLDFSTGKYAYLFYKFKVKDTGKILTRINSNSHERRYDVSELELSYNGKVEAITVGTSWIYEGYSEGCGLTEESTLTCTTDSVDTLKLDVHSGWWKYANDVSGGVQVASAYFGVPNSIFSQYGTLQQIKANWYKVNTDYMFVCKDKSLYQALLPYVGVNIGEYNSKIGYQMRGKTWAGNTYYNAKDIVYDAPLAPLPGNHLYKINWLFYSKTGNVSSESVQSYMEEYSAERDKNVLGKYNSGLFWLPSDSEGDKKHREGWQGEDGKGIVIDASVNYTIEGFDVPDSVLDRWFLSLYEDLDSPETGDIEPFDAIYLVQESDVRDTYTHEQIAEKLHLDASEISEFLNVYEANKLQDKQTVLFRFDADNYSAKNWEVFKEPISFGSLTPADNDALTVHEQYMYLDFDIIWLKFVNKGVETVIPTVSKPIDVIGGLNEPQSGSIRWWIWLIVAIIVLVLLCIFIRPLWTVVKWIIKILWYIISAPFRFIAWIVRKVKERKNK